MKKFKPINYLVYVLLIILFSNKLLSQVGSNCIASQSISLNNGTATVNNVIQKSMYYWYSFVVNSNDQFIKIENLKSSPKINKITVYAGINCNSLSIVGVDSIIQSNDSILKINLSAVTNTVTYYLKLEKDSQCVECNIDSANYNLLFKPEEEIGCGVLWWINNHAASATDSSSGSSAVTSGDATQYYDIYLCPGDTLQLYPYIAGSLGVQGTPPLLYNIIQYNPNNFPPTTYVGNPHDPTLPPPTLSFTSGSGTYSITMYQGILPTGPDDPNFCWMLVVHLLPAPIPGDFSVNTVCVNECAEITVTNPPTPVVNTTFTTSAPSNVYSTCQNGFMYNTPGTYSITMTIPSQGCGNFTTTQTLSVISPSYSLTYTNAPCSYNYTFTQSMFCTNTTYIYYFDVDNSGNLQSNNSGVFPYTFPGPGTYTITGASDGDNYATHTLVITVPPISSTIPTLTISPSQTICASQTSTLNVSGADTYTWSTGANTSSIVVSPTVTTTYNVEGTTVCGSSLAQVTVYVAPIPTISVNNATICTGQSATLSATGGSSYVWSNGTTTSSIVVSPTITTQYTVTGITSAGCTNSAIATVSVIPKPFILLQPNSNSITLCPATSYTLKAFPQNGLNYVWSNGATTNSIVIAPTINTTYTVTGTSTLTGCSNYSVITVNMQTVTPISISPTTLCLGQTATLTANGSTASSNYTWSTGATGTNTIVITPTVNTTYTVTATTACGTSSAVSTVTVRPVPNAAILGLNKICSGNNVTLIGFPFFAPSYQWNTGSTNQAIIASPSTTTTYTLIVTNNFGCTDTAVKTITVTPTPTINITATSYTICSGSSTTLTASGANNYTWSPANTLSSNTGSVVVASPNTTTTYTVRGSNGNGCFEKEIITIVVLPTSSVTVNSATICSGQSVTLTANGANTYSWSTGQTTNSIVVSPTITTYYTVNNINSCSSTATSTVTVNTGVIPAFAIIAPNNGNICASGTGSSTPFSTTIPNSSSYTYLWSPGNSTSATPNINITQPVSVKVTVTDAICGVSSVQDICVNYVASICCSNTITTLTNTVITDVAQLPNSTYKVSGTLTFNIPNSFQAGLSYKEFLMSTGSKIIVTPTTSLTLHVCKLYSCEGMWEGIELQSTATNAAMIDINDGTVIEDAYRAVSANTSSVNVGNKIKINIATFNKNYTDVYMQDWIYSGSTYSFESVTGSYVSQSSSTSPGGNLKCSQYYTPTIKARSYAGIYANNTTSVNVGNTTSTNTFFINSFSNKDYGVIFEKTSGWVTNAKFNNMAGLNGTCPLVGCIPPLPTGIGIVATTNLVTPTTISVTSTPAPVTFTNVECAVYARRATNLYVLNTVIENPNQTNWNMITTASGYGYNGIYTEDIKRDLHINYNTIKNAMYGVQATYVNASNVAVLSISNNTIMTTATNFTTSLGINVSSAIGFIGSPTTMPIAANILTQVRNGIQLTGLIGGVKVSGNTINMKNGNAVNTTGSAIYLAGGNTNCMIDNNDIFGNSTGAVQSFQYNKIGINVKGSANCFVQCNRLQGLGTGVRYDGICTSPATGFFNNALNAPIRRGLELRNSASMGTQGVYTGVPPAHTVVSASENQWNGSWNTTNTDQTYVNDAGSNALASRLCVSGGNELPTDNQWNTTFATAPDSYGILYNSLLTSSTAPPVLSNCPNKLLVGLKVAGVNDSIATVERDEEYKRIITQNLTDPIITNESKWQLKDFMYRNIANGSAPMDATVQSFYAAEQSSSVNTNRTIDSLMLLGDYTQASSINGSAPTNLVIEQTAKDYNSLWLQKFSDPDFVPTSSDITTLNTIANQCLHKGGKSVAHARALLGAIYNHPFEYTDDCMDDKSGSRLANTSHFETNGNVINLFPNPNNGNFTLGYYLTKDVTEAEVIVEDITGKLIYQSSIDVNMDTMSLHLTDAKTGIYFVKVMSGKEIISVNKVIITN
jgi:hypothetical protein